MDNAPNAIMVGMENWPATSNGSGNADVFNNINVNSPVSIVRSATTAPDIESDYNIFFNSPRPNFGKDANSLVANPMFLADGSYKTAAGSPARNSAYNVGLPLCAAGQNQACICGGKLDRGAIESDCVAGEAPAPSDPTPLPLPETGALSISKVSASSSTSLGTKGPVVSRLSISRFPRTASLTAGCTPARAVERR